MYVNIHIYTYLHVYVSIYIYVYIHVRIYVYVYILYTYVCMYLYIYTHICKYVCMYIYIYLNTHACIYIHMHIYVYIFWCTQMYAVEYYTCPVTQTAHELSLRLGFLSRTLLCLQRQLGGPLTNSLMPKWSMSTVNALSTHIIAHELPCTHHHVIDTSEHPLHWVVCCSVFGSVLQSVAVYCITQFDTSQHRLHWVVCCSVFGSVLQSVPVYCITQFDTSQLRLPLDCPWTDWVVCCSVLSSVLRCVQCRVVKWIAVRNSVLRVCCNALQCFAVHTSEERVPLE